jgi:hypothetical protein
MFGNQKGDPRVRNVLQHAGLTYDVDNDGDFRALFNYDDGRSQIAFINSNTEIFAGAEIREVWSVGLRVPGQQLNVGVANHLLALNSTYKVGSWETKQGQGEILGIFRVSLSADAGPSELTAALRMAALQADELEKLLLGNDAL